MFRIHEDLSFNSDSEDQAALFIAFYPAKKEQGMPIQEQLEMMLRTYPESELEIKALAYAYGLIPPEEDAPYTPRYNRYLLFFNPEQDRHPNPAINAFCASLTAAKRT